MQEFWNVWKFLSITVFRECQGWKFWNFLEHYSVSWLELHKNCNAQKNQLFTVSELTKLEHSIVSWPEPHKTL